MYFIYQTKATASGGRDGKVLTKTACWISKWRARSMAVPAAPTYNPVQFLRGYAACFDSALNMWPKQMMMIDAWVTATVGLKMSEASGFDICVALEVEVNGV
jgi:organic hydroperoxide reductase OsmC/OhrA